jgi:hypothetical protein
MDYKKLEIRNPGGTGPRMMAEPVKEISEWSM